VKRRKAISPIEALQPQRAVEQGATLAQMLQVLIAPGGLITAGETMRAAKEQLPCR
jgi:hypothetical protein